MKDRTIAVTGARGRVGRLLVRELLDATPYRYETSVEKAKNLLGHRPRYSVFDMVDEAAVHLSAGASA